MPDQVIGGGVSGALRGGDTLYEEELASRVAHEPGDLITGVTSGLDDIGGINADERGSQYHSTGFTHGKPINFRVGYGTGPVNGSTVGRLSAVSRYAPSSVLGVTRPQGAVIGEASNSMPSKGTSTANGYGFGIGSYNSGSSTSTNITGRVSVMSKASNRSSVVSGVSLAGSQPITRLGDPAFYNSSKYKTLQESRHSHLHFENADSKLAGLGTYSEYWTLKVLQRCNKS